HGRPHGYDGESPKDRGADFDDGGGRRSVNPSFPFPIDEKKNSRRENGPHPQGRTFEQLGKSGGVQPAFSGILERSLICPNIAPLFTGNGTPPISNMKPTIALTRSLLKEEVPSRPPPPRN